MQFHRHFHNRMIFIHNNRKYITVIKEDHQFQNNKILQLTMIRIVKMLAILINRYKINISSLKKIMEFKK